MSRLDELQREREELMRRLRKRQGRGEGIQRPPPEPPRPEPSEEDGPLGLVSPELRQRVRQGIESIRGAGEELGEFREESGIDAIPGAAPGLNLLQGGLAAAPTVAEAGPATAGTAVGGAAGMATGGPAGALAGGMAGGAAGEALGQEVGLAPRSNENIALSGAAPAIGAGASVAGRVGLRALSGTARAVPAVRAAVGQIAAREAAREFMSIGGRILARKQNLPTSKALFSQLRQSNVRLPTRTFRKTMNSLDTLKREFEPLKGEPGVNRALNIIDNHLKVMRRSDTMSFTDLINLRVELGDEVRKVASGQGRTKIRAVANRAFKNMVTDMDRVAKSATHPRAKEARLFQQAFHRFKLEASVKEFDQAVAMRTKLIPGDQSAMQMDVSGMANWLRNVTNPKSKAYKKNFADAFKDDLPQIRKRLSDLSKLTQDLNPAGRGSIVVRGITARLGQTVGGTLAGGAGAAGGRLAGASGPEALLAVLMDKRANSLLQTALTAGAGEVSYTKWMSIAQAAIRGSVALEEEPEMERRGVAQ